MIRAAVETDVEAIARLEEDCLGVDAWSFGLISEGVADRLPTISYLVAEVDGDVVGYAVTSCVADIAELQRIAVDAAHRRLGLAGELLDEVVALAQKTGADRLLLEVREGNDGALKFYADKGFVEIDRRKRYYRDGSTAAVMRLPLMQGCGGAAQ